MEALKQIGCMSGAGMDTLYSRWNGSRISFVDRGQLEYYQDGLAMKKMKKREKAGIKKKLKLLKGLSKDLSTISGMGFAVNQGEDLVSEVRGKLIREAADVLMKQLEHLKAEEKELKRKRKEEKGRAKLKLKQVENSSESSSNSGDSECGEEIIPASRLVPEPESVPLLLREGNKENDALEDGSLQNDDEGVTRRVEVCMGNKCKKSGSGELLEEFQRLMEGEGDVVGCKCMGKCRDGPNVRLFGSAHQDRTPANPLCIGVALVDVGAIVGNFFSPPHLNPAS